MMFSPFDRFVRLSVLRVLTINFPHRLFPSPYVRFNRPCLVWDSSSKCIRICQNIDSPEWARIYELMRIKKKYFVNNIVPSHPPDCQQSHLRLRTKSPVIPFPGSGAYSLRNTYFLPITNPSTRAASSIASSCPVTSCCQKIDSFLFIDLFPP